MILEVVKNDFSEKLQLIRKNRGLTLEELAEKLSVSRQAVAKWKSGQVYPEITNLIQISNLFNATIDYLVLELKDGFVLYHGSYCEVKEPDLAKCAKRKDFGQGFYLTTSKEQAESFLRTSIAKAIATGTIKEGQKFGYISTFEFNLSGNLETHIFENADVDWLHCIAAHRKKKMFIEVEREMARYDIIAGKIADDATNATLTAYLAGAFGTAGDKEADDFCIRQLLPNKLKDQYCFKTEAAIECLKFVKGEKIWLK